MAAYCNRCSRYVNQYCERCGGNAGISSCEVYSCGGTMICPLCGGGNLVARKDFDKDSRDAADLTREEKIRQAIKRERGSTNEGLFENCPNCDFEIVPTWKYCPECGIRFSTYYREQRD